MRKESGFHWPSTHKMTFSESFIYSIPLSKTWRDLPEMGECLQVAFKSPTEEMFLSGDYSGLNSKGKGSQVTDPIRTPRPETPTWAAHFNHLE